MGESKETGLRAKVQIPGVHSAGVYNSLFVGNRCACWAGIWKDLEARKSNFLTPCTKVGSRLVEGFTKFDEHVE